MQPARGYDDYILSIGVVTGKIIDYLAVSRVNLRMTFLVSRDVTSRKAIT